MSGQTTPAPNVEDLWKIVYKSGAWTGDTTDAEKAWWLRMINAIVPATGEDPIRVHLGLNSGTITDGVTTLDLWTRKPVDTPIFTY